jgi:hypothetical protein
MNIPEIFLDASRYAASDWTKYVYLGILFIITDLIDRSTSDGLISAEISIILLIVWIFLLFVVAGYIFRIIEDSVDGQDKLPHFRNVKQLFAHGLKESWVVAIYLVVPSILFYLFTGFDTDLLNPHFDGVMPVRFLILSLVIGATIFILLQGAILNMAYHKGRFRAAFYFREIFSRVKTVGIPKFIMVCILTGIILMILEPFLRDDLAHSLDYVGGTIIEFTLIPYLTILTSRFLGIMGR